MTVTLAAPKMPLILPPADAYGGDLVIADIGIPRPVIDELEGPWLELLTRERMRELVPARAADSHKGDFGRVLVIAGSIGRTGAAHLAALGALRSGAGLVTIATPRSCVADDRRDDAGVHDRGARGDRRRHHRLQRRRSRARPEGRHHRDRPGARPGSVDRRVRPGDRRAAGRAAGPRRRRAERVQRRSRAADRAATAWTSSSRRIRARWRGCSTSASSRCRRIGSSTRASSPPRTASTSSSRGTARSSRGPKGGSFVNLTGNAGMATGGTGDLLTGMIAAWFAQILDAEGACKLAVYLHGTAGDLAEADEGEVALLPSDIAARLGDAVIELTARRKVKDRPNQTRAVQPRIRDQHARDRQRDRNGSRRRVARARRCAPATSCCSTAISARARPRSSAAWRAASARIADEVSSPTFTLVQEYAGRPSTLYHVDLYRLEPAEIDDLGLEDLVAGDGIVAIEWAERWNAASRRCCRGVVRGTLHWRGFLRPALTHYPTITRPRSAIGRRVTYPARTDPHIAAYKPAP